MIASKYPHRPINEVPGHPPDMENFHRLQKDLVTRLPLIGRQPIEIVVNHGCLPIGACGRKDIPQTSGYAGEVCEEPLWDVNQPDFFDVGEIVKAFLEQPILAINILKAEWSLEGRGH